MSKKSKRQSRSVPAAVSAASSSTVPESSPIRTSERGFNPDYSPVIKDLKRIGTLAGTFFLIMIVLSFILK